VFCPLNCPKGNSILPAAKPEKTGRGIGGRITDKKKNHNTPAQNEKQKGVSGRIPAFFISPY
ncbi:MAG: hypothetical protein ACI4QY_02870, partial [Oscillospiraceae bacterium]